MAYPPTSTTIHIGATLHWATDISLNAVMLDRLDATVALSVVLFAQVPMHKAGVRPSIGSLRALTTLALL